MALNFKKIFEGLNIVPKTSSTVSSQGDIDITSSDGKANYHNGTSSSPVVTEAHASQGTNRLKNKDLEDSSSAIVDASDTTKKILFDAGGTTGTTSTITGAQTANRVLTLPDATTTFVGTDATQTLTNKTIDADLNTITNIENADIKAGAAIAVNKLAALTANKAVATDASGFLVASSLSDTDLADALSSTNTKTVTNKSFVDSSTYIIDNADNTKKVQFEVSGVTTGTTRTLSVPNLSDTLVTQTSADQGAARLKNKDLDTTTVFFDDGAGLTGKVGFDVASSSGTLTLSSLISASRTAFIPDNSVNYNIVGDSVSQQLTNKDIDGGTASNSRRITVPKDTKSNLDSLTRKEATIVYASDQDKLYVDNGSTLVPVGSGSGGGVNFLVLDSTFQPTQSDNGDLEASIGSWAAYADAAGVMPVDMNGGSPSITVSRTTTSGEVLNGAASLKVVKGAANEQGEGISCVANVPLGYRGQVISVQFPFKVISGSLVDGDIRAYVYDITNSSIITPTNNYTTATGLMKMTFLMPSNTTQIRFGLHFASTSASAVTYTIDDIQVGPQEVVFGPSMTDWRTDLLCVPDSLAFGTVTNEFYRSRIVGDTLYVEGNFETGTTTGNQAFISLPAGYVIDDSKLPTDTNAHQVGEWNEIYSGGSLTTIAITILFYDGSTVDKIFINNGQSNNNEWLKADGNAIANSNEKCNFSFQVPVVGLSTNVVQQNAGMFSISNYLANGTRVTGSAPTSLGEYRSYLRNASANTFTETSGSPTTSPTSSNGIVLYAGTNYGTANSSNSPTKYDIFVGKNKKVMFEFYESAGRTGNIDTDIIVNGTSSFGVNKSYDPATGIATVVVYIDSFATTAGGSGLDENNGFITSNIYFDIFVSEQVVPVQIGSRSEIYLTSGNGHGSTNTKIRRYSNLIKSIGNEISYTDSATDGASFIINNDGCYAITIMDVSAGGQLMGVSVNSTQLTTNIDSITNSNRLINVLTMASGQQSSVSVTSWFNAGDIIRCHTEGSLNGASDNDSSFRITKIS